MRVYAYMHNICTYAKIKLIIFFFVITAAGIPYEVIVVAFTSAGKGEENDRKIFFSEELAPTKSPEDVGSTNLSPTSFNITWTPLDLFEARGFPEYRVVATPKNINRRRRRQSDSVRVMMTENRFAVFTGLRENTDYTVVVGVRTGNMSEFLEGDPIEGIYLISYRLNCIAQKREDSQRSILIFYLRRKVKLHG